MRHIYRPTPAVAAACPPQRETPGPHWRWSHHAVEVPCPDGVLLAQTMTGELLLLTEDERAQADRDTEVRRRLAEHWFLVPPDHDDRRLSDQVRHVRRLLTPKPEGITTFVVLTTTDCNARCPYCYEQGVPRRPMTEAVAHDAAAYIRRVSNGRKVRVQWFGGEPLYNVAAIDTIVSDLREAGVDYCSGMISNGYLFDDAIVARAVADWKLDRVQITLDGTEDVYNRTKAFVYRNDPSPYRRVLDNVDRLLRASVRINIRLNLSRENYEDMCRLAEELSRRFAGRKGFWAYPALLFDAAPVGSGFADRDEAFEKRDDLRRRLRDGSIGGWKEFYRQPRLHQCMADGDQALVIQPTGGISICEHETENTKTGATIYDDTFPQWYLDGWRQRLSVEDCDECAAYPDCINLRNCPVSPCFPARRRAAEREVRQCVYNTYEQWRRRAAKGKKEPAEEQSKEQATEQAKEGSCT